jgi:hypothetical protein
LHISGVGAREHEGQIAGFHIVGAQRVIIVRDIGVSEGAGRERPLAADRNQIAFA